MSPLSPPPITSCYRTRALSPPSNSCLLNSAMWQNMQPYYVVYVSVCTESWWLESYRVEFEVLCELSGKVLRIWTWTCVYLSTESTQSAKLNIVFLDTVYRVYVSSSSGIPARTSEKEHKNMLMAKTCVFNCVQALYVATNTKYLSKV